MITTLNTVRLLFSYDVRAPLTTDVQLRNHLVRTSNTTAQGWLHAKTQVMTVSPIGIAIMKGPVVTVVTNIGSPVRTIGVLYIHTSSDLSSLASERHQYRREDTVSAELCVG